MLHQKLKDFVTCFSPLLRHIKHMEEITVGGEIVRILNMADLQISKDDTEEGEEQESYVYVSLDDGLGELNTILVDKVFETYKDKIFLGNVVLIEGIAHKYSAEEAPGKKSKKAALFPPPWDVRIFGVTVSTLPQNNQEETCKG